MEWQPMKTVPRMEFQVLILGRIGGRDNSLPCFWDGKYWKVATIFGQGQVYANPTHWMFLPKPPQKDHG